MNKKEAKEKPPVVETCRFCGCKLTDENRAVGSACDECVCDGDIE